MCGSVHEGGEGRVLLQGLRKVLCALCTELISSQTANGSQNNRQRLLTIGKCPCGVLEGGKGLVFGEALREVLGGFGIKIVARDAASESRSKALVAANSRSMRMAALQNAECKRAGMVRVNERWCAP